MIILVCLEMHNNYYGTCLFKSPSHKNLFRVFSITKLFHIQIKKEVMFKQEKDPNERLTTPVKINQTFIEEGVEITNLEAAGSTQVIRFKLLLNRGF